MFISVNIDMATTDHVDAIDKVLKEYGIKKVQDRLYESSDFITKSLGNLKKDISDIDFAKWNRSIFGYAKNTSNLVLKKGIKVTSDVPRVVKNIVHASSIRGSKVYSN